MIADRTGFRRVAVPLHLMQQHTTPPIHTRMYELSGLTMGTSWHVKCLVPPTLSRDYIERGIEERFARIIAEMSTWQPESLISRFNCSAPGTGFSLPEDFSRVLECALRVAGDTYGAFDPAAGPLVDLWGFGASGRRASLPDAAAIAEARGRSRFSSLRYDSVRRQLMKSDREELNFSSIAKGYAVDLVAAFLTANDVPSFLVEVGGELRGHGVKADGLPWWVGLEKSDLIRSAHGDALGGLVVALNGLAIATSGNSEHFFEIDGQSYGHTIDPRSGVPVAASLVSVSVLHESCMEADALSTAMMVLGVDDGLRYAERHQIAARFVVDEYGGAREWLSPAFEQMLA